MGGPQRPPAEFHVQFYRSRWLLRGIPTSGAQRSPFQRTLSAGPPCCNARPFPCVLNFKRLFAPSFYELARSSGTSNRQSLSLPPPPPAFPTHPPPHSPTPPNPH